jgi:hypothetical protein
MMRRTSSRAEARPKLTSSKKPRKFSVIVKVKTKNLKDSKKLAKNKKMTMTVTMKIFND